MQLPVSQIDIDTFETATIAIVVFFFGKLIVGRSSLLQRYSIPEPVIGGFAAAIIIALVHYFLQTDIIFDVSRREIFLVYFFAALGLRSSLRELASGWRPLLTLIALASVFVLLQNGAGSTIAAAFGYDPKLGIVAGSMALIGRTGTTIAWAPVFEQQLELGSISRLGIAVNMSGLIAACCIGGPVARFLIRRHRLAVPGRSGDLDVGISRNVAVPPLDYYAVLLAVLTIHLSIIAGQMLHSALQSAGITMPLYVSCLAAGVVLGNLLPLVAPKVDWDGTRHGLSLLSDIALGLFYTMTLMSLHLWAIEGIAGFVLTVIVVQALLAVAYAAFVVFPMMGRDYEAAVMSSGFVGLSLGSTATTMAIMTAVAGEYGRARKAFLIVPVVCGFFIDIVNSLIIAAFTALL